jgi:hypothetical protein
MIIFLVQFDDLGVIIEAAGAVVKIGSSLNTNHRNIRKFSLPKSMKRPEQFETSKRNQISRKAYDN